MGHPRTLFCLVQKHLRQEGATYHQRKRNLKKRWARLTPTTTAVPEEDHEQKEESHEERTIRCATAAGRQGYAGKCVNILLRENLPIPENPLDKLRELHPDGRHVLFPPQSEASLIHVAPDRLIQILKKAASGKAPGPSGWTEELLLSAVKNEKNLAPLCAIVADMANNRIGDKVLVSSLISCRLVAIGKQNGGIRPIALIDTVLKLATSFSFTLVIDPLTKLLENENQFGLTEGGAEKIIHQSRLMLRTDQNLCAVQIDCTNAFNTVSRQAMIDSLFSHKELAPIFPIVRMCYERSSSLFFALPSKTRDTVEVHRLKSKSGCRQGDVLGPALFALALHPVLRKLRAKFPAVTFLAYLDDITVIGRAEDIIPACAELFDELKLIGLEVHKGKTKVYGTHFERAAETLACKKAPDGFRVLGAWISREKMRSNLQKSASTTTSGSSTE